MYRISNTDYALLLRLLRCFAETKGNTLRESEQRRKALLLRRRLEKKTKEPVMKKYLIEVRVDKKYLEVECSGNTPAMFADEIRKLAKEYFKEEIQC